MPVRSINFVKERPPMRRGHGGHSPVESTSEYQDVMLMLGAGLNPQEFLEMHLPVEHPVYLKSKNPIAAALTLIKKKIKTLKLPYDAYAIKDKIYIVGRGVEYS